MAATKVHFGYIDHSAESTRTQLYVAELESDGSNFPNVFDPSPSGSVDNLRLALDTVTKLNETNVTASLLAHEAVGSIPADATAQREIAARMTYVDNVTGKKYRFDIPAPDDAFVPTGTDDINMAAAVWVTFKGLFEANAVSPDGNAVTLQSGKLVGRRS